ncbi:uncharacterized protein LOC106640009 [Copidosoma floridanum]|uniref:uncharacterized protein LOC106640009 n=1 Tax=Copidosoma floridanum TaxID=29053 RepID=UPI0006C99F30|nr:uncharacterized protein LOC106640009 [Copidosoma floridanum]
MKRKDQLIQLLRTASMELDKWASNEPRILEGTSSHPGKTIKLDNVVSTLGVKWNHKSNCLTFSLTPTTSSSIVTNREILSKIARLFDPLGWLAPIIIVAKLILQELWLHQLDWDTSLNDDLSQHWLTFNQHLRGVEDLSIPRWPGILLNQIWHLHGFYDASKRAYAAAIYSDSLGGQSTLLLAKTKVASIKRITIPRLELCGAMLLLKLAKHLVHSLSSKPESVFLWTDSQIIIEWLKKHPSHWPTFVANSTSMIIATLPDATWSHVRSESRPNRGLTPVLLSTHRLWWQGPTWITKSQANWPATTP